MMITKWMISYLKEGVILVPLPDVVSLNKAAILIIDHLAGPVPLGQGEGAAGDVQDCTV